MTADTVVQFSDEKGDPRADGGATVPVETDLTASIKLIQRWRKVLSLRWLMFIALLGAVAVWGLTVADPTPWRFIACCGYSVGVLIPSFFLYDRRAE